MREIFKDVEPTNDTLIQLRKELELAGLDSNEINDILERYKSTYDYTFYELRIASYNFVRNMKKSLKNIKSILRKKY